MQHPPQSSKVPAASYGIPIHDESKVKGVEETRRHTAYASRGTSPVPSKVVLSICSLAFKAMDDGAFQSDAPAALHDRCPSSW